MTGHEAELNLSVSTWRRPIPPQASEARAAALEHVAARILSLNGGRLRVGIDGFTAGGETSFGHELDS